MSTRPTIRQIAEAAGVSTAVVSAVVNGKENHRVFVSDNTKNRVQAIIREKNYVPLRSARSLRSKKTDVIGAIFNSLNPYYAELLEAIQRECLHKRLEVLPCITNGDARREVQYLQQMADGRVDGVIICAHSDATPGYIRQFSKAPFNLRIVTTNPHQPNVASVHVDERRAGQLVADHLLQQDRRRMCYFSGSICAERAESFLQTIREARLEPLICVGSRYTCTYGDCQTLAAKMLSEQSDVDAVFCHNDEAAMAMLGAAIDCGRRVPEDLAIIGYDNSRICQYPRPSLSSIDTNVKAIARIAVHKLNSSINNEDFDELHTTLEPTLIVRASSVVQSVDGGRFVNDG